MLLPLSDQIQWGTLERARLGGQYIEQWVYYPGDESAGVHTADLTTLREENPARDLTAISSLVVVFGPLPTIGPLTGRRMLRRNDQGRIIRPGAVALTLRIVSIDTATGGIANRLLMEQV